MPHSATEHFKIIDVTVNDDFLERRTKAATSTAARWRKLASATAAIDKANCVATALIEAANGGSIPASLRQEVGAEIKKHSPTHDPADASRDFEVAVVAAVAAIMLFETTTQRTEHCNVFAEALSAAMDIAAAKGAPKVVALWRDLSSAARIIGDGSAEKRRERQTINLADPSAAVQALAANASRDQEELNVLWWTLNDWSTLGQARFSAMPVSDAVTSAAIELAGMLDWPAVRALRQLAHRNIPDSATELAIPDIRATGAGFGDRVKAALEPLADLVSGHPRVFTALFAVMSDDPAGALADHGIDSTQAKPAWRWTERLVRELSLASSAGSRLGPLE